MRKKKPLNGLFEDHNRKFRANNVFFSTKSLIFALSELPVATDRRKNTSKKPGLTWI